MSVWPSVVSAVNVTGVRLVGLALLHSRNNGIDVHGSDHVEICDSAVANHGGIGINVANYGKACSFRT